MYLHFDSMMATDRVFSVVLAECDGEQKTMLIDAGAAVRAAAA